MVYYRIGNILEEVTPPDKAEAMYAAILSPEEWAAESWRFDMGIEQEVCGECGMTKAEVNYDSLTGCFSVPDRDHISAERKEFAFALDEKGIVFVDGSGFAREILEDIRKTRKWREPSLERFLYDFLEQMLAGDPALLSRYEKKLETLEDKVQNGEMNGVVPAVNEIRGDLLDLRSHYSQLAEFAQELEENENSFFADGNLRYFHLIGARIERLEASVQGMREYCMQIRDLYQTQIDVRQNKIMTVLTVISTIFFPLTVITGWYGMNFKHMPELEWPWAYPALMAFCFAGAVTGIVLLKKKKWL